MKTSTIKLNDTSFKEIEGIIQKVAQDNNISDVASVSIKLSKDQSLVSFDKVAVPKELAEEVNPYAKSKETGRRVSPSEYLLFDVITPLNDFLEIHQESGMVEDAYLEKLTEIEKQLRYVWFPLSEKATGSGVESYKEFDVKKEEDLLHPSVGEGRTYPA